MNNTQIDALVNVVWDRLKNKVKNKIQTVYEFKDFEDRYNKIYTKIVPLQNELNALYLQIKILAEEFDIPYSKNKDLATYKKDYKYNIKYNYPREDTLTKEKIKDFIIVSSIEGDIKLDTLINEIIKMYEL